MKNFNLYDYENNILFENILNEHYFKIFKTSPEKIKEFCKKNNDSLDEKPTQIEFIITSECNLKCEYCYLHKFADQLVPPLYRDHDLILKNLRMFMEYWIEQDFCCDLDIFTGEIWFTDFGISILETILLYIKKGAKIPKVMIPSNCTFLLYEEYKNKIQDLINNFRENGTNLIFSASVDGKIIENFTRPFKNKENHIREELEFYDELGLFCTKNGYGYHPMISAVSIEKWIENLKWWKTFFKKFYPNKEEYKRQLASLMMLEVRNDDWTEEKLEHLKKFMNYYADCILEEVCDNDIKTYIYINANISNLGRQLDYSMLNLITTNKDNPCSLGRSLCIRMGDLAIVPCHRCGYDKLVSGYFNIKNEKITNTFTAKNIEVFIQSKLGNMREDIYHCYNCLFNKYCHRGCLGSQVETMQDPFASIESVCNLSKVKIIEALKIFEKYGCFEYMKNYLLNYNKREENFKNNEQAYIKKVFNDLITFYTEIKEEYVNEFIN